VDGANYNTVKNTIVTGVQGATSSNGTTLILSYTENVPNSNNTLQNNLLMRATYGIHVNGGFTTTLDQNWTIVDNTIGSATAADKLKERGISLSRATFFDIHNNTIRGLTGTKSTPRGIAVFSGQDGSVTGNRVSDVKQHLVPNAPQGGLCSFATGQLHLGRRGYGRLP
jgi:nitrous oxidase accessory protein NosD